MTTSFEPALQYAGAASEALIAGYDRASGNWTFPRLSPFWDAVVEAHRRGQRGFGRRIAILDSAFDLSMPILAYDAAVCLPNRLGADLSHGTAVALLVRTVAPEASLDLYAIGGPDGPDRHAVGRALRKVATSEATVLCMSLGVPVSSADIELELLDPSLLLMAARPRQCPMDRGCLCEAVATLGDRAVFAAVGNDAGSLFCPAMSQSAYAIGFQLERRIPDPERGESAWATQPSGYDQSAWVVDYTLMQPENVLGSSFATPLVAGSAALQDDPAAIESMQQACHLGAVADTYLADYRSTTADRGKLEQALDFYEKALVAFPHQADLRGGSHWCVGCAIYGGTLFVNAGLAHLEAGDFPSAEPLLRIARQIAPRSADAAANLATCLTLRAEAMPDGATTDGSGDRGGGSGAAADMLTNRASLLREAVAAFDEAIALRPDYRGYDAARARAAMMLASRGAQ